MSDYTKFNDPWVDADSATGGGDESTPIPAAALDHIEAGIDTAHSELQAHLDDTSAAHAATAIESATAGNLGSTNVQAALQELQGDIDTINAQSWQIILAPLGAEPPTTIYATLDLRNNHPVLDFDASTVEWTAWSVVLPARYSGSGLNVKLVWAATSATAGNVVWEAGIERIPAGALDIDADSFATGQTVTAACDSVSGETTESTITLSDGAQMDSLAAGEMFRLYVQRNATSGSDTMAGDAELLAVVVTEQ